jgi:hypothetical protein
MVVGGVVFVLGVLMESPPFRTEMKDGRTSLLLKVNEVAPGHHVLFFFHVSGQQR